MEVIVTAKAAHDLDEWLTHIEADNPPAAEAFRARIRHWIEVIRQHPQAGHKPETAGNSHRSRIPDHHLLHSFSLANRNPSILAFRQKSKINSLSLAVAEYLEPLCS